MSDLLPLLPSLVTAAGAIVAALVAAAGAIVAARMARGSNKKPPDKD